MKPIKLNLGPDVAVRGAIYRSMNPVYLRETLLEIDTPSGETIAVGWSPHRDPAGAYRVNVFRDYWTDENREEYSTPHLDELLKMLHRLVESRAATVASYSSDYPVIAIKARSATASTRGYQNLAFADR